MVGILAAHLSEPAARERGATSGRGAMRVDANRRRIPAARGRGCYAAAASCSNGPSHTSTTPAGCGARTGAVTTPS